MFTARPVAIRHRIKVGARFVVISRDGTVVNPQFALSFLVNGTFTFEDDAASFSCAHRSDTGRSGYIPSATCSAHRHGQRDDYSGRTDRRGAGTVRSAEARPSDPQTGRQTVGRIFLSGCAVHAIFAHFFNQRGALQGQEACCLRNDTIGQAQCYLDPFQFEMFDLRLQIDGRIAGRNKL